MTYDDAATTCQALTLAGGGWRLPAIGELHSLSVTGPAGAAIDLTAFPGATLDATWSATPILGSDSAVMVVNFDDATVNNAEQVDLAHLRCVR